MVGRIRFALERFGSPRHRSHVAQLWVVRPQPNDKRGVSLMMSKSQKNLGWWLIGIVLFLFAYALSSGPAVYLQRQGIVSSTTVDVIYRPIQRFENRCAPLDSYLSWWFYSKAERERIAAKKRGQ